MMKRKKYPDTFQSTLNTCSILFLDDNNESIQMVGDARVFFVACLGFHLSIILLARKFDQSFRDDCTRLLVNNYHLSSRGTSIYNVH
mmetsp:Transcript_66567/g.74573  ORF Transcript_66567/g.74573 Transcript_66567/m.74573 type:complete len:87 (-) Transcript_66567:2001-2261(-)